VQLDLIGDLAAKEAPHRVVDLSGKGPDRVLVDCNPGYDQNLSARIG